MKGRYTSCPQKRVGFTLCDARTRDHRREATYCCCFRSCSPVLLLLWFGHTYARKTCASLTSGRGYTQRDTAGYAGPDMCPLTATERRLREAQTTSHITAGIHRHTSKVLGCPLRRRLSERPSCKKSGLYVSRATSRHVCFMSRQAARS